MISRDIKATAEALNRAAEEYGSLAHLARELGVGYERLKGWRKYPETMPIQTYYKLIEILGRRKK